MANLNISQTTGFRLEIPNGGFTIAFFDADKASGMFGPNVYPDGVYITELTDQDSGLVITWRTRPEDAAKLAAGYTARTAADATASAPADGTAKRLGLINGGNGGEPTADAAELPPEAPPA